MATRLEARLAIADLCGDLTEGSVAATAASGSNTVITDYKRTEPDDNWKGAEIWINSGAASGNGSTIVASIESATSLEVNPAIVGLDVGADYELHAIPVNDYHRVMQVAYDEVKHFAIDRVQATGYTLSGREIDLSVLAASGWSHLFQIEIDRGSGWEKIKASHWRTVPEAHTVRFSEFMYNVYLNKSLRISGYIQRDAPTADDEEYTLPRHGYTYLLYRSASLMLMKHPDWFDANQKAKMSNRWESEASRSYHNLGTLLMGQARLI